MAKSSAFKSFSLIFETENLGMATLKDLESSLNTLKKQDFPIKSANEVLVIVGSHVSSEIKDRLKNNYPWLKLHISNKTLEYSESKFLGAKHATGEVVIFADSDMRYEKSWLGNLLNVFNTNPEVDIVAGDTRVETNSPYSFALNLTWMVTLSKKISEPSETSYFHLNNFAIRRKSMLRVPPPFTIPLYRNKIPLWEEMLKKKGYRILRAPSTRGHHAPPGTFIDWLYRMAIYGSDFVAMVDFSLDKNSKIIVKRNFKKRLFNFFFLFAWKIEQIMVNSYKLAHENKKNLKYLPVGVFICFANIFVMEVGAFIAVFNRNFVFNKITDHESKHIV